MRTLPLALAAAVLATTAACSDVGSSGTPSTDSSGGGDSGGGRKVAFVSQVEGIPYFSAFEDGAKQAAKKYGINYHQAGPSTANSTEQRRIFDSLVEQGYDAIAVSPLDPRSMNPAIAKARKKGIVVITSDADAPKSERQVFVQQATDDALGATAMDQLAKDMGGKGEFGIVSGAPDTQTFNSWIDAVKERQREKYPDAKLVGKIRYTTDTAQALKEAQDLMTAYPNLKGIIAVPSTAAPGVARAVQNADKKGEVAVTSFASPRTTKPFVKSGVMRSTVLWDVPKLGELSVWTMKQLLDGEKLQESNTVPGFDEPLVYDPKTKALVLGEPLVFTRANIDRYDF